MPNLLLQIDKLSRFPTRDIQITEAAMSLKILVLFLTFFASVLVRVEGSSEPNVKVFVRYFDSR